MNVCKGSEAACQGRQLKAKVALDHGQLAANSGRSQATANGQKQSLNGVY